MERREFLATTGLAMGAAACAPAVSAADDDAAAVRRAVENVYSVFYQDRDKAKYRELLADDYLLLEHGELLDIEGDMALMPPPGGGFRRTDAFDFRSTKVHGDTAYVVYFLKSDVTDEKGARHREWLESAVLRRSRAGAPWRMALLHSTRINPPAK